LYKAQLVHFFKEKSILLDEVTKQLGAFFQFLSLTSKECEQVATSGLQRLRKNIESMRHLIQEYSWIEKRVQMTAFSKLSCT